MTVEGAASVIAEGAEKILNQEEVDALINGIDMGAVSTEPTVIPGEARNYDFINDLHVARGRMPALEMINERFARLFHQTLYNLLRRSPEISVSQVTMKKFNDYVNTLHMPTNLNVVRINPLRGLGLVVLDPKLVFTAVDNLFGGVGRSSKVEGRDFTATEQRIIHLLLRHAFSNLKEAWSKLLPLEFEHVHSEINPHFAKIVNPTEIVVISSFRIELQRRRRRSARDHALLHARAPARAAGLGRRRRCHRAATGVGPARCAMRSTMRKLSSMPCSVRPACRWPSC